MRFDTAGLVNLARERCSASVPDARMLMKQMKPANGMPLLVVINSLLAGERCSASVPLRHVPCRTGFSPDRLALLYHSGSVKSHSAFL